MSNYITEMKGFLGDFSEQGNEESGYLSSEEIEEKGATGALAASLGRSLVGGSVIGGGLGAATGAIADKEDRWRGAKRGAMTGAAIGAGSSLAGNAIESHGAHMRSRHLRDAGAVIGAGGMYVMAPVGAYKRAKRMAEEDNQKIRNAQNKGYEAFNDMCDQGIVVKEMTASNVSDVIDDIVEKGATGALAASLGRSLVGGSVIGGGLGAATGAIADKEDRWRGAKRGAMTGAAIGAGSSLAGNAIALHGLHRGSLPQISAGGVLGAGGIYGMAPVGAYKRAKRMAEEDNQKIRNAQNKGYEAFNDMCDQGIVVKEMTASNVSDVIDDIVEKGATGRMATIGAGTLGGVLGSAGGAISGAMADKENRKRGALRGALAGGVGGAAVGAGLGHLSGRHIEGAENAFNAQGRRAGKIYDEMLGKIRPERIKGQKWSHTGADKDNRKYRNLGEDLEAIANRRARNDPELKKQLEEHTKLTNRYGYGALGAGALTGAGLGAATGYVSSRNRQQEQKGFIELGDSLIVKEWGMELKGQKKNRMPINEERQQAINEYMSAPSRSGAKSGAEAARGNLTPELNARANISPYLTRNEGMDRAMNERIQGNIKRQRVEGDLLHAKNALSNEMDSGRRMRGVLAQKNRDIDSLTEDLDAAYKRGDRIRRLAEQKEEKLENEIFAHRTQLAKNRTRKLIGHGAAAVIGGLLAGKTIYDKLKQNKQEG